ncbi:MAG: hypothetical protein ACYTG0_12020 [Planctomycetota bacterium]
MHRDNVAPFLLNDTTMVTTAEVLTVGQADYDPDVIIDGLDVRGVARIGPQHAVEAANHAGSDDSVRLNGRSLNGLTRLAACDQLALGRSMIRIVRSWQGSQTLLVELSHHSEGFRTRSGATFGRVVLLRDQLRMASQRPCHLPLAGLNRDAVAIGWDREGRFRCWSVNKLSWLRVPPADRSSWICPIGVPGRILITPSRSLQAAGRPTVRLVFEPL